MDRDGSRVWRTLLESVWSARLDPGLDQLWEVGRPGTSAATERWPDLPHGGVVLGAGIVNERGTVGHQHLLVGARVDPPPPRRSGPARALKPEEIVVLNDGTGLVAALTPTDFRDAARHPDQLARLLGELKAAGLPDDA